MNTINLKIDKNFPISDHYLDVSTFPGELEPRHIFNILEKWIGKGSPFIPNDLYDYTYDIISKCGYTYISNKFRIFHNRRTRFANAGDMV